MENHFEELVLGSRVIFVLVLLCFTFASTDAFLSLFLCLPGPFAYKREGLKTKGKLRHFLFPLH